MFAGQEDEHRTGQICHIPIPDGDFMDATVGINTAPSLSDLTCNVPSSCRKRRRNEPLITLAAPIYCNQQPCFPCSTMTASLRMGTVTPVSRLSSPFIDSQSPSSNRMFISSTTSPEILELLNDQRIELDNFLQLQNEKLRLAMEEMQKYCLEILSRLTQRTAKLLREKEDELMIVRRRNAELEEKVRQMCAEGLVWFNLAKNKEAVVISLRTSLQQALVRNKAATISFPAKEGYGDSDGLLYPADDAQSCCFEPTAASSPASSELRRRMLCRVCRRNKSSVLALPCRHLCLCLSCEAVVDTCPICLSRKNASLQIFLE